MAEECIQASGASGGCLVIMGVSACGKTTVGAAVAQRIGGRFVDGDDHHSRENVAKMAAGIPLTDGDRMPWLAGLHEIIATHLACGSQASLVVACSALARRHRDQLLGSLPPGSVRFVHLAADSTTILGRLDTRQDHFMKGRHMLEAQFAALESLAADELATGSVVLNASDPVRSLTDHVVGLWENPQRGG